MDEDIFNQAQQDFLNGGKKKEEEPLKSDEWLCEKCNYKNIFTKDPNSCICTRCKTKNPNIAYMIQSMIDEGRNQNEQKFLDYFNQNKGK